MKKITKLSLAASLLLGSSLFADSLEKAFADSKIKGEIKTQYFDRENAANQSDNISVIGGNLGIVTGTFYGLNAGFTFQATNVLGNPDTTIFDNDMHASGAVMSEAYLGYKISNTAIKAGRQYITTPLLAGSGSRMVKQSFEGFTISNTDIQDTILTAAYVDKYQHRTSTHGGTISEIGNEPSFEDYEDGAWSIHAKNNSIENLTLQGQYLDVSGTTSASDKDALYLDASYNLGPAIISGQLIDSTDGSTDGKLYGAKVSGNVGMVNLTGIYTTTTDDGKVFSGVGSGADSSFTALPINGGGVTYTADTDTMVAVAATQLAGATLVGYYGIVDAKDNRNGLAYEKIKAYGGFVEYPFTKSLSLKVMYETASFDTNLNDLSELRVYTSFKF